MFLMNHLLRISYQINYGNSRIFQGKYGEFIILSDAYILNRTIEFSKFFLLACYHVYLVDDIPIVCC